MKTFLTLYSVVFGLCTIAQTNCSLIVDTIVHPGGDCNGVVVDVYATGQSVTYAMYNDFNNDSIGHGWNSNIPASFTEPCDPSYDGGGYMWMGNTAANPRIIQTAALDLSCGGEICFYLDFATQANPAPCEGPDLPNEGVYFGYSTNGGANWTDIQYFHPQGGANPQMTSWNQYCYQIPPAAQTPTTLIRWAQNAVTDVNFDHWGIDDVVITTNPCNPFWYNWEHLAPSVDDSSQTIVATQTSTYTVYYTNGIDSCSQDFTIVVPPGPNINPGADHTICLGDTVVIGGQPVSSISGAQYAWNNSLGNGTISQNDNGQIMVSPAYNTHYQVSVSDLSCTSFDTIEVVVDNPPTASNPQPIQVECQIEVPLADIAVVTDEQDDIMQSPIVTFVSDVSDGLACPETITRTYRVSDLCFNHDVYQTIVVYDTTPPLISGVPTNLTIDCIADLPVAPNLNWIDNCDGTGYVAGADVSDGLTCPETITRTWTITDACGNTATETQIISVIDMQSPVLAAAPADTNVECVAAIPVLANLEWTDNCNGVGSAVGTEVSDGLTCPETITRTWTIMDACGNTATETQIITVLDTQSPIFIGAPSDTTVECIADIPVMADLAWSDNCDGVGVAAGAEVSDGLTCPETITRTWFITDACGNTATETQIITVLDTQSPLFTGAPSDTTVQCLGDLPVMANLAWIDNCDGAGSVIGVDISDGQSCPETITRTWSVTDFCGNTSTEVQTIIIMDSIAPIASNPLPISVPSLSDVPQPNVSIVTNVIDNCTLNPIVAFVSEVSDGNICNGEVITHTHTA